MDYNELIERAIQNDEVVNLLIGENGYRVEVSQFVPEVLPTDINSVLVNCFYKQKNRINNIEHIFIKTLMDLLKGSATNIYIAVLYFNTCIFHEERGKAPFQIDREMMAEKNTPLSNIMRFNKDYVEKYGFCIIK